ncbi:uncharacterized protein LOC109852428 [Pseudomyrmex gracilis]|uniref:uncharacterized protein LOC109852428 n=1 Tax=Pseudomyrmex gracilis TaxID=219809 RepID=UPI000995B4CF|nr:uncharacterized protein LOC109852428 [Pseudomyrmex gracilis]
MNTSEESLNDPDYVSATSNDQIQQKIYEETARKATAQKITAIVDREFSKEIEAKEKEILEIEKRLHKALKIFHLLRYVIITNFYNRKQCQAPEAAETKKQTRIHPAIKSVIGKRPKVDQYTDHAVPSTSTDPRFLCDAAPFASNTVKSEESASKCNTSEERKRKLEDEELQPRKIPRYVPPKSSVPEKTCPSRSNSQKVCKRVVVGNMSKWIPLDWREDNFSHKWTMYVRGEKDDGADISSFVSKVRFFLHPSYHPNDIVEVTSYPFYLCRRGWGEFPLRVQLHFKNTRNKPMDIIHNLKLDQTCTGLQTLGSETLVDVWIYTGESRNVEQNNGDKFINHSVDEASVKVQLDTENNSLSEFIPEGQKNSADKSWLSANSTEVIQIKKEMTDLEVNESSNLLLDVVQKSENKSIKVESDDMSADDINDSNQDETRCFVDHDHSYFSRQCPNSHNRVVKEENITINHVVNGECVPSTNLSANDSDEKKPNRFNGIIESSNTCQYLASSNTAENDLFTASIFQDNNVQDNLFNASSQDKNSENSLTSESLSKDTSMTSNGYCKPSDASLNQLNNPQKATSSSSSCSLHLKPLKISIPSNVFISTTNKRIVLVQDKSILVKSGDNSKKLDGNMKISRDSNVAKLNIRVPQGVSILKKSAIVNAPQKTNEKMITLKGTNSVLLSANENIPILKIADSLDPRHNYEIATNVVSSNKQEFAFYARPEEKMTTQRPKITLGKDKHKIQSKKELYVAILRSIDSANITDTEGLIRFIIRRLPIVTENARDPEYKQIHPYACRSEDEYLAHNIGKQRALEWCRAKMIKYFLHKKQSPADQVWSVKEIVIWARVHGYTPSKNGAPIATNGSKKTPSVTMSTAIPFTCTEPVALQKWLQTCQQSSSHQSSTNVDVEKIDVETVEDNSINQRRNNSNQINNRGALIPLELERSSLPFHKFVCDTARDIGIKIGPEEIVPGVLYCAAGRMIMRVVECFVEDLTRSSFAKSLERNNEDRSSVTITPNDVRNALANREEFDILTNDSLGSRQQLSVTELANQL